MGSILRATLILGSGSAVGLVAGFLSNKAYAVWVGPEGVGLIGLLQGLLGLLTLGAGVGLSAGLVRLGAPHASVGNTAALIALRQAAWQIYTAAVVIVCALLLVLHQPISRAMLGGSETWVVGLVAIGVTLSLAAGIQIGLLNAHHRVAILARVTALSSIFGAIWGIGLVWTWREAGVPWILLGTPLGQLVLASYFTRHLGLPRVGGITSEVAAARAELIRFGLPYTGSQLVGTAVQLAMPFVVLSQLGQESVGYYRAAMLFSTAYIGFLLNALGQDYYPRLSVLANKPDDFRQAINTQQRFILFIGSPLVALSLALTPLAVTLLFSADFRPAATILHWQLLGDLLRFVSWTLSFAVLAGLPNRSYLVIETLGGLSLLGFSVLGMMAIGLEGLGIGWLTSYGVYLLAVGSMLIVNRRWLPDRFNVCLLLASLAVCVLVLELPQSWKLPTAIIWSLVCGLLAVQTSRGRRWVVKE